MKERKMGKDAKLELLIMEEEATEVLQQIHALETKRDNLMHDIDRIRAAIRTAEELGLDIYGGKE